MELARRQQPRHRVAEHLACDNCRQRIGPVAAAVSLDCCRQSKQRRRDVDCDGLGVDRLPELDGSAADRSRGLQRSHLGHSLEERNRRRGLGRSRSESARCGVDLYRTGRALLLGSGLRLGFRSNNRKRRQRRFFADFDVRDACGDRGQPRILRSWSSKRAAFRLVLDQRQPVVLVFRRDQVLRRTRRCKDQHTSGHFRPGLCGRLGKRRRGNRRGVVEHTGRAQLARRAIAARSVLRSRRPCHYRAGSARHRAGRNGRTGCGGRFGLRLRLDTGVLDLARWLHVEPTVCIVPSGRHGRGRGACDHRGTDARWNVRALRRRRKQLGSRRVAVHRRHAMDPDGAPRTGLFFDWLARNDRFL